MNTPICDFINEYKSKNFVRLHMPGHKGKNILGLEEYDITEIKGADSLYEANSIIAQSEKNASELFGCKTYYSTEGSSLCIRAMMHLASLYANEKGEELIVFAGRNAHKTFLSAAALLGFEVEWLNNKNESPYLSASLDLTALEKSLSCTNNKTKIVYITTPDYLGNIDDVRAIAEICDKNNALLFVDNAHGAYLRFLTPSCHPIDLGAHLCCDSAHKTLPVLTGGAYIHLSDKLPDVFEKNVKSSLSLFGSTSPSYLIMQSLDYANKLIQETFAQELNNVINAISSSKNELTKSGYSFFGNEPLKLTIGTKEYGYSGNQFADILRNNRIECEFSDTDFVVLMLSAHTTKQELQRVESVLKSIPQKQPILTTPPTIPILKKQMSIRKATLSSAEVLPVCECIGRVAATPNVSCPPAVPIVVSGEIITREAIKCFDYYEITHCSVVKE